MAVLYVSDCTNLKSILIYVDMIDDLVRDEKRAKFCPSFDTIQVLLIHTQCIFCLPTEYTCRSHQLLYLIVASAHKMLNW